MLLNYGCRVTLLIVVLYACGTSARAQAPLALTPDLSVPPNGAISEQRPAAPPKDPILGDLAWREIGPAVVGGRVDDFAVLDSNPDIMYVGTASGGAWKTTDGGMMWKPIFEHVGPMSIGAIAVAQSDPSIVWIGSGEANNRQSSSWGSGVFKSTDAGATWTNMGLKETQNIGRIVIDPNHPDTLYVAALGHLFGANEERGLYKSTDGGSHWTRVLFINPDTGVVDVKMDPQSPNTVYAAAYERRRTAFGFNGGGASSALYKSTDGGTTWKKLVYGLPYVDGGDTGRIGIAVYLRNPKIVYAEVQHAKGGLYRSDDAGETWTKMSDVNPNAPYFSNFYIDPNNDLRIWVAALQESGQLAGVALSEDGGKTFAPNRGTKVHPDFHAMWIDPANSNHMIIGVDGGMYVSRDLGRNWERLNQIPIGQAYQVGYDMAQPYHVCAGYQDNGTAWGPSRTRNINGILNSDWMDVLGGDGFHCQPDQQDSNLVYVESQDGTLLRLKLSTHEWANVVPQPKPTEEPYRYEWNAPVIESSHKPERIYFGAQYLFRSDDRGDSWAKISPDLTTGVDRNKLPILGKTPPSPILSKNYGVSWYPCITRISESPLDPDVLWVGTEDGNLQVTRDAGKTWQNVTAHLPAAVQGLYVSGIEASRLAKGDAYAVIDGHRSDDFSAHIFFTTDFGETWRPITSLPSAAGVARVLREDPINSNLLFVGTEFGAYLSTDRGAHWSLMSGKLPSVRVDDIKIQPRDHDLILATHGRSLWILDDMSALEKPGSSSAGSEIELFDLRPAIAFREIETSGSLEANKPFLGENPPYGAIITYRLKQRPKEPVVVRILNQKNELMQKIDGTANEGLNRVSWNLRYPTLSPPSPEQQWAMATGFFYKAVEGPLVEPGEYHVEVSIGGQKVSMPLRVEDDPMVTLSAQDREQRQQAILHAYALYKIGFAADARFKELDASLTIFTTLLKAKGAPTIPKSLQTQIDDFSKKMGTLAPLFASNPDPMNVPLKYVPPPVTDRIARVLFILESYSAAPRPQDTQQLEALIPIQSDSLQKLQELIDQDLANLNRAFHEANIPYINPPVTSAN
jgi:photosystem II stability/assembly factor-like uncharacterized protein